MLDGLTALLVGGAGDIGSAVARMFATHGARVALVDREAGRADDLAADPAEVP